MVLCGSDDPLPPDAVGGPGERVAVRLVEFSLEESPGCSGDRLTIEDEGRRTVVDC